MMRILRRSIGCISLLGLLLGLCWQLPAQQGMTPAAADLGSLPDAPPSSGQRWHRYDIRPYTSRCKDVERPQQSIVDWILRETGTDVWFGAPGGMLTADRDQIAVYHTSEIHRQVGAVVERFVHASSRAGGLSIQLVTVESPNWRTVSLPHMQRVPVQTPGVEAWLLSRENASMLMMHLKSRVDYQEHNSANVRIANGQSHVLSRTQPRSYAQDVAATPQAATAYRLQLGQVQEGYWLAISPLVSRDGQMMEAVVRCRVDQVEKMNRLDVEIPAGPTSTRRVPIEIPQMASWQVHERFRWPIDQVLLVSRGIVAMPLRVRTARSPLAPLLGQAAPRGEALLFLEVDPQDVTDAAPRNASPRLGRLNYRGRY